MPFESLSLKNSRIAGAIQLYNARAELKLDLPHKSGRDRTMLALAIGALDHAIEWLISGKVTSRKGLYTALLYADFDARSK